MKQLNYLKSVLVGGASVLTLTSPASAKLFDIPSGDLAAALNAYMRQAGVQIVYSNDIVQGHRSNGAKGQYSEIAALTEVLNGTGFAAQMMTSDLIGIVPTKPKHEVQVAQAARRASAAPLAPVQAVVETVVVTAQKRTENIQNVPIAVTALSQQQLTERQIAGGPDLLRDVPNMNFSKTNFTGYNIELRGIGTQAISVTTDPAVAVAFNDTPFIRNHFFEQEFYDLQDVEVLRGPQGTLYGRNATAGVVNLKSALPTDQYEAMLSADIGNFSNRRLEAMLNLPVVGDKFDIRLAGEWTRRDGYSFNTETNRPIDGRDLWSTRFSIAWKPTSDLQSYFIWEHFSENDDRLRSGKQLCKTAPNPVTIDGITVEGHYVGVSAYDPIYYVSQGCEATSLYSPDAFETPNGYSLSYASAVGILDPVIRQQFDPYASTTQSLNLRNIESAVNPSYRAKNDTLEWNTSYTITPALTFTSQTGYNHDFLWSAEDFNRFNTAPGIFIYYTQQELGGTWQLNTLSPAPSGLGHCIGPVGDFERISTPGACYGLIPSTPCRPSVIDASTPCYADAVFCDPQVGCSDRLVAEDLSEERSWQFSQEFRLASNFNGPFNFSAGGNFLHYETEENYYVFINTLTHLAASGLGGSPDGPFQEQQWLPGMSDNSPCLPQQYAYVNAFARHDPQTGRCAYIDPNPLASVNNQGHNYFLSQNPYVLNSYALFGEAYYDIAPDLKVIAGARWTDDRKHFIDIPSELLVPGYGYPVTDVVNQGWNQWTGRSVVNWTPKLDFTDQTLIYGSYAHGYKAGGANPPGATLLTFWQNDIGNPIHPKTFKPEFVDAFELGTKNTLLNNSLTLNGDIFYYAYRGYQISEIVDRTAINNNFNASVRGAEVEANWEPVPGLKFGFTGGYENATANRGDSSIDLMDRTAGNSDWMVLKPFVTQASNCILPKYVVAGILNTPDFFTTGELVDVTEVARACEDAYVAHLDPVTLLPYAQNPSNSARTISSTGAPYIPPNYPGFDPLSVDPSAPANVNNGLGLPPNDGEGFSKNLGGHQLPNAPHFTTSFTAEYSMPVSDDWVGTLHADFYWQSQSWARIFNDRPYDKLHGYSNVNLSLILTSSNGWQVMGYVKNVFNSTAITGDFLNSDDTGLTTNVFLTDPRLFGVRVTKQLDQSDGFWGSDYNGYEFFTGLFSDTDNGKPPLWIELGGGFNELAQDHQLFDPPFIAMIPSNYRSLLAPQRAPDLGLDWQAKITFEPEDTDWQFSVAARYGRASRQHHIHQQTNLTGHVSLAGYAFNPIYEPRYVESKMSDSESHAILDFMAGKSVGLGNLGIPGQSTVSAGVRYAAFTSSSGFSIFTDPDESIPPTGPKYRYHRFASSFDAKRSFHGVGPAMEWKNSTPLLGDEGIGEIAVDWGANGAVLFGRQRAAGVHKTRGAYYCSGRFGAYIGRTGSCPVPTPYHLTRLNDQVQKSQISHYQHTKSFNRSRMVTVPDIGAFVGLSMKYRNAKVSFGYRVDEFFGAVDGGIDNFKSENRGYYGPYANISVGIGG